MLMLKLKLQYFGQLMRRTDSLEKTLMLGKIEVRRRRGRQRMRWLDGIPNSIHEFNQAPGAGDGQGSLVCCSPWSCKELDMTEQLNSALESHDFQENPRFAIQRLCDHGQFILLISKKFLLRFNVKI